MYVHFTIVVIPTNSNTSNNHPHPVQTLESQLTAKDGDLGDEGMEVLQAGRLGRFGSE